MKIYPNKKDKKIINVDDFKDATFKLSIENNNLKIDKIFDLSLSKIPEFSLFEIDFKFLKFSHDIQILNERISNLEKNLQKLK